MEKKFFPMKNNFLSVRNKRPQFLPQTPNVFMVRKVLDFSLKVSYNRLYFFVA